MLVQDEYDDTNKLREELRRIGPSVILTCVSQESLGYVYPRCMFPGVRFESVLTGYISNDLLEIGGIRPLAERRIVIRYRGRDLSFRYGDLARQKAEIGLRVREACLRCGVPCDIEVDSRPGFMVRRGSSSSNPAVSCLAVRAEVTSLTSMDP